MSVHPAPYPAPPETSGLPVLSLAVAAEGPALVLAVRGPLDLDTVDVLSNAVDRAMAGQPPPVLVLDLSGVSFFGAAGVTVLLRVRRRVVAAGRTLVLREPSRICGSVLNMVGLRDEFITE
ncbi:STAS domain-containing protein [Micromonospora sp. HK10]|uniref:STAS domain-containing protein n=1 Tax=Micromonospora sp. HK10 TaxID=1538294 RepID=UPI00062702AF|nr:STAS domain-containing protein [Micromonospora sp. HK10]